MRIVARAELHAFGKCYPDARASLESWIAVVECANWKKPADVKLQYRNASILKGRRVVFNIGGNRYRMVAEVNYVKGVVQIRFLGSLDIKSKKVFLYRQGKCMLICKHFLRIWGIMGSGSDIFHKYIEFFMSKDPRRPQGA